MAHHPIQRLRLGQIVAQPPNIFDSMSLLAKAKQLSLAVGLYRPARWVSRRVRPRLQQGLDDDIAFYRSLLKPGALCFDVGANVGDKSEALLEAGARVVSFEPNPTAIAELTARCSRYKHWTLVPAALGASGGIAELHAQADSGKSSFDATWANDPIGIFHVPVVTLDAAIGHFGIPDFCKIDVEGWELEVFHGLSHRLPLVCFEFHLSPSNISKTQSCLRRLAQFGPSRANITPAESNRFHFTEWLSLDELLARFPGNLKQSLPGDSYGDIFVQSNPEA